MIFSWDCLSLISEIWVVATAKDLKQELVSVSTSNSPSWLIIIYKVYNICIINHLIGSGQFFSVELIISEFGDMNLWYSFLSQVLMWRWKSFINTLSQFKHLLWFCFIWVVNSCLDLKNVFSHCLHHLKCKLCLLRKCANKLFARVNLYPRMWQQFLLPSESLEQPGLGRDSPAC